MAYIFNLFTAVIFGFIGAGPAAGDLKLVRTTSRLPLEMYLHSSVYDGQDAIYLIGGRDNTHAVIKYSLESGAVENLGSFPERSVGTAIIKRGGEEIVYFGGWISSLTRPSSDVYSYSTTGTRNYTVIGELPNAMRLMGCAWYANGQLAYLVGGSTSGGTLDSVLRYDAINNRIDVVARLPTSRFGAAAVWEPNSRSVYIFGGSIVSSPSTYEMEIHHFDPSTGNVTKLDARLPRGVYWPCAVLANDGNVYMFSGSTSFRYAIRFDPSTHQSSIMEIEGWPEYMIASSCAYVQKLDRVYIMGGYGRYSDGEIDYRDEIAYVDLSTGTQHHK